MPMLSAVIVLGLPAFALASFSVPLGEAVAVGRTELGKDWPLVAVVEVGGLFEKILAKGSGAGLTGLLAVLLGVTVTLLGPLLLGICEGLGPSSVMGPTVAVLLGLGLEATGVLGLSLSQAVRARSKHKTMEIFIAENTRSTRPYSRASVVH